MTADAPGRVGRRATSTGTFGTAAIRRRFAAQRDFGPFDAEDLDADSTPAGLLDFGSIRIPVPPEGTVTVEPTANGRLQAVHVTLPGGRLSVSALAAPKSSGLWAELVAEIDSSLREGGARVRSFQGDWGRELHARTGAALSVFVGVDGARWMLYGVATGPERHAVDLDAALRRMLKGTVVDRGRSPFPVRTVLPLTVPDELAGADAVDDPAADGAPAPLRPPAPAIPPQAARSQSDRSRSDRSPFGPSTGRPPTGQPPTGQPPTGQPPTGQPPTGQPPTGWPAPGRAPAAPPAAQPPVRAAGRPGQGPVPVHTPDPVVPRRIDAPTVIRPLVARPAATASAPHAVPRPPVTPPPVPDPPAPVDPPQARPVAHRDRPAETHTPLWATPPGEFDATELGPDPATDPHTDGAPTEWWPAPTEPAPRPGDAERVAGSAATPLHDELDAQVRRADAPPDDGYGAPNHGLSRVEDPHRPADADATQRWPAVPAGEPVPRRGRHGAPDGPDGPDPRHTPPDPAPRAGRRRRADGPGPTGEPTLDLAALVRDRPGRRHSRHEDEDRPRRSGRRRAEDRPASVPAAAPPAEALHADPPGWSAAGWPGAGWSAAAAGAAGRAVRTTAPDMSPQRAGRRRAPDPADVHGPVVPGAWTGDGSLAGDPVTDPLPAVGSPPRRRRSVDVPPDPDWAPARTRSSRDGSAPALAFLAEPEPDAGPGPRHGRHHRPS